ncbi:hypothetical protein [Mucilaginibacter sp.]|uniref:hypothetical protein n=1 Tax=Mucilaginibacter sp. TaxID=1882438 RepID=UPI003D134936
MNQIEQAALSGIGGTTVMTASSYLMSLLADENFREPEHLEVLIGRLAPHLSKRAKVLAGWGAHFAMGFVFASVYVELWESKKIKHNLRNGLLLGLISGVLGFLIWKATFKIHPLPPWINFDHYYLQRIPAHVVFAVGATITYRLLEHENLDSK